VRYRRRVEIELTQGKVAVIDEDYPLVAGYKWRSHCHSRTRNANELWYAVTSVRDSNTCRHRVFPMHHLILTKKTGLVIDHIDGNGLNNSRSNLRYATPAQSKANTRPWKNGSSRFKGVTWKASHAKWQVEITVNGRKRFLGLFSSEEEAAVAYDRAAKAAWGDFARPNFAA
jgi:hypothetical protein